ncbi:hypothetical protein D3C87_441060 [compost metagenome]
MKKFILLCFIVVFSCNSTRDNNVKTISVNNSNLFISELENENTLSTYITESPILNNKIPKNNIKIIGDSNNYYSLAIKKSKKK